MKLDNMETVDHTRVTEIFLVLVKNKFWISVILSSIQHRDSLNNTVEENSSVFSLIQMC